MSATIDLSPRTVVRWTSGKRDAHENVTPTPFGQDRAEEIWAQRGIAWALDHAISDGESAYVSAVWDTLPGSSCWMTAFFEILNGRI